MVEIDSELMPLQSTPYPADLATAQRFHMTSAKIKNAAQ